MTDWLLTCIKGLCRRGLRGKERFGAQELISRFVWDEVALDRDSS
jgi:hypothetical protein